LEKILVIEDNEDNLAVVESYLEDDYHIISSDNGEDGIELAKKEKPGVILLDISLPNMDGVEVLKYLKKDEKCKDIPVIALTAHAMAGDQQRFLQAGFDEYVSKPIVDDEELIQKIETLLRLKNGF